MKKKELFLLFLFVSGVFTLMFGVEATFKNYLGEMAESNLFTGASALFSLVAASRDTLKFIRDKAFSSKNIEGRPSLLRALASILPERISNEELSDAFEHLDDLRNCGASRAQLARAEIIWAAWCLLNAFKEFAAAVFARRRG